MERILAISAHYDDVELAMGGTLISHRDAGDEIFISVLNVDDWWAGDPDLRDAEQTKSITILKVKDIFLFRSDDPFQTKVETLDRIEPTILYIPFPLDTHQDHVNASQIGMALTRRLMGTVYQWIGTTSHSYFPNVLKVIDINRKKELVSVFKSQTERNPKFVEIMEAQNRFFGSLIPGNGHYAEGFCVHRIVQF